MTIKEGGKWNKFLNWAFSSRLKWIKTHDQMKIANFISDLKYLCIKAILTDTQDFYTLLLWTKEIQIIHRLLLAIAMYYWAPLMNH